MQLFLCVLHMEETEAGWLIELPQGGVGILSSVLRDPESLSGKQSPLSKKGSSTSCKEEQSWSSSEAILR